MNFNLKDLFNIFKSQFSMEDVENEFNNSVTFEFFGDEPSALAVAEVLMPENEDVKINKFPSSSAECSRIVNSTFSLFFTDTAIMDIDGISKILKAIPINLRKKVIFCVKGEAEPIQVENVNSLFSKMTMKKPIWYMTETMFCEKLIKYLGKSVFSAARIYPGLRDSLSDSLIFNISRDNAGIALVSSIPAEAPIVGPVVSLFAVPGETVILTANQIRLAMRIAAIYGAEIDFFARMGELWPILAGSFGWKAVARTVSGFIPVAGPAVKASIAFGGTYVVGTASKKFYRDKKLLTTKELKDIYSFAKRQFFDRILHSDFIRKIFGRRKK